MNLISPKLNSRKAQIFLGLLVFGLGFASPSYAQYDLPPQQPANTAAADAEVRMQGLESTIRDLTGKIEQQDYQIKQLKDQLDKLTSDVDIRIKDIQSGGGGGSTGGGFNNNPIHSGSNDSSTQYQNNVQDNSVSSSASSAASTDDDSGSGYKWHSNTAASAVKPGQLGTLTQTPSGETTGNGDAASDLYESAYSLLKSAQYDEAEKEFKSFLKQYPSNSLVPNAKYWLGETYYVRGQFEKAAQTFAEGYQAAPKGSKAADNLLKMGMSLSGMNKKPEACVALGQIGKEFATTAGPVLSRAKQEMTRLGC